MAGEEQGETPEQSGRRAKTPRDAGSAARWPDVTAPDLDDAGAVQSPGGPHPAPGPGGPHDVPGPGSAPAGPEAGCPDAPAVPPGVSADPAHRPSVAPARPPGVAGLSFPAQIVAALALALVLVGVLGHLLLVFLHVAPENTLSRQHGGAVEEWVYPEFEQNWKLFAPNPLQQNVAVQARAEVRTEDGSVRTTRWYDLSAMDGRAIEHNPLPSHTQQNALRRSWDFYVSSHDGRNRSTGLRGNLSEEYVKRLAMLRLHDADAAGPDGCAFTRIQLRSRTTQVAPPSWSGEGAPAAPVTRELPWWSVTLDDLPLGRADAPAPSACVTPVGGAR